MELKGEISKVLKKSIHIIDDKSRQTYICHHDFFLPAYEGDTITATIELSGELCGTILTQPLVRIGQELSCYEKTMLMCKIRKQDIAKLLTVCLNFDHLAGEGEMGFIDVVAKIITKTQATKLYNGWMKFRIMRQLYLFTLTKTEINKWLETGNDHNLLLSQIISNPYSIPFISIQKCNIIFSMLSCIPSQENLKYGSLVRTLYNYLSSKEQSCVSSSSMNNYPDINDEIGKEYGIKIINKNGTKVYTLSYVYDIETYVADRLNSILTLPILKRNCSGVIYKNGEMIQLTEEQKNACTMALQNPICCITGGAGVGKTTLLQSLYTDLKENKEEVVLCSFTGKAVSRLRSIVGGEAYTIHSLIKRRLKFSHIIIDEASMVTTQLMYELFKNYTNPKIRITFVGDVNQLPCIGWGKLFYSLLRSDKIPLSKLSKNHRSQEGILVHAERVLRNEYYSSESSDYALVEGGGKMVIDICKALHSSGEDSKDITVITPLNNDVNMINNILSEYYLSSTEPYIDALGKKWRIGDRVMLLVNRHDLGVVNGDEGIIHDINSSTGKMYIHFSCVGTDGGVVDIEIALSYSEEKDDTKVEEESEGEELSLKSITLSYAMTIHKSQGSEWKYIVLYIPDKACESRFVSCNMLYTAITRARKNIWVVGKEDVIMKCSKNMCNHNQSAIDWIL